MTINFNEIPKDHPSHSPEKRLFRFHSGATIDEVMKELFVVSDMESVGKILNLF